MADVTISPEVELQEERALVKSLRTRNLVLAQFAAELRTALAEREETIKLLEQKVGELTPAKAEGTD